ncbi:hypothetical protein CsatB_001764 [Cannabis sativa]
MAKVQIVSFVLLVGILISSFGFNGTLGQDTPMLLACCKSTKRPDLCPHSDSNPTKCDAECKKGPCRGVMILFIIMQILSKKERQN